MVAADEMEQPNEAWKSELVDRIEETIDRKRSSVQGREATLAAYIRILTSSYAEEEIRGKEIELVASFLKSIKAETSEKETILAMKGIYACRQHGRPELIRRYSSSNDIDHFTLRCHL